MAGDNDIVVRNLYASICGTDVAVYNHGPNMGHRITVGGEFGHEMVSEVVQVGDNVKDIHVGDRVYPYPRLAKGDPKRSGTVGGFSEYVLIPNSLGFIYPDIRMPVSYRNYLISEIVEWKPDVIHSQCEFFSFQFARHISKRTRTPLLHTYHTLYEQYVNYVIPNKHLGCRAVCVIKKRLEQHERKLTQEERMCRRRILGIPDDNQVILSLGRLGIEKNLEELLTLFAQELTYNQKLTFLIVGDGPDRARLESLTAKLRFADQVIFTGMVSPSEVQITTNWGMFLFAHPLVRPKDLPTWKRLLTVSRCSVGRTLA